MNLKALFSFSQSTLRLELKALGEISRPVLNRFVSVPAPASTQLFRSDLHGDSCIRNLDTNVNSWESEHVGCVKILMPTSGTVWGRVTMAKWHPPYSTDGRNGAAVRTGPASSATERMPHALAQQSGASWASFREHQALQLCPRCQHRDNAVLHIA